MTHDASLTQYMYTMDTSHCIYAAVAVFYVKCKIYSCEYTVTAAQLGLVPDQDHQISSSSQDV